MNNHPTNPPGPVDECLIIVSTGCFILCGSQSICALFFFSSGARNRLPPFFASQKDRVQHFFTIESRHLFIAAYYIPQRRWMRVAD